MDANEITALTLVVLMLVFSVLSNIILWIVLFRVLSIYQRTQLWLNKLECAIHATEIRTLPDLALRYATKLAGFSMRDMEDERDTEMKRFALRTFGFFAGEGKLARMERQTILLCLAPKPDVTETCLNYACVDQDSALDQPKELQAKDAAKADNQPEDKFKKPAIFGKVEAKNPQYASLVGLNNGEVFGADKAVNIREPEVKGKAGVKDPAYQTLAGMKNEEVFGNDKANKDEKTDKDASYEALADINDPNYEKKQKLKALKDADKKVDTKEKKGNEKVKKKPDDDKAKPSEKDKPKPSNKVVPNKNAESEPAAVEKIKEKSGRSDAKDITLQSFQHGKMP
ncbi:hypothetical protein M3Y97_00152800 [Aphelenchoides bicaudatus]|nr:hypothetical protein M3Y97_00152800 [Aphelenchoides bicaudatus]